MFAGMEINMTTGRWGDFTDFYCEVIGLMFHLCSGEVSILRWFMGVYYSKDSLYEYNKARGGYILDDDMMGDLVRKTRLKAGTARIYLYSLNKKGVLACSLKTKKVNIIYGVYEPLLVGRDEKDVVIKMSIDG